MAAWPELRRRYGGRLLHRLLACADACHAGQPAGGKPTLSSPGAESVLSSFGSGTSCMPYNGTVAPSRPIRLTSCRFGCPLGTVSDRCFAAPIRPRTGSFRPPWRRSEDAQGVPGVGGPKLDPRLDGPQMAQLASSKGTQESVMGRTPKGSGCRRSSGTPVLSCSITP